MARLARVIAIDTPHHVTQRGNARSFILERDSDRLICLQLLRHYTALHDLRLLGYCLMSNHVHLVVTPRRPESLSLALKYTHGRYAAYFNTRHVSSGHVWQGRYYSCPLDLAHLWAALRYTELNPVRAGMAQSAVEYTWSSARIHCGEAEDDGLLDLETWRELWTPPAWRDFLGASRAAEDDDEIRRCTHTGRPLGAPGVVKELEASLHRRLKPSKGGRPAKQRRDSQQTTLSF